MKGRPIDQLVYECMFPKPKAGDPQNFQAFLQRNLVPEVRLETTAFYGHLSSQEAKYPGLDYSHPPHRVRLSRFQWHRRLFRAFDNLRLTKSEIASLTKWEGTRWAKERFEKEEGVIIRDTTGDGIKDWVPPELRVTGTPHTLRADIEDMEEDGEMEEGDMEDDDDGESDTEIQSVGIELNERLRAAVAQREAGNSSMPLDEEWEQWLKDAVEHGYPIPNAELSPNANIPGTRPAPERSAFIGTPSQYHQSMEQAIAAHNRRRLREFSYASARSPSPSTPVNYRVGVNTSAPIGSYPRLDQRRPLTGIEYHIREAPYSTSSVPSLPPQVSRTNISSARHSQPRSS
jgi:hypothetical protein